MKNGLQFDFCRIDLFILGPTSLLCTLCLEDVFVSLMSQVSGCAFYYIWWGHLETFLLLWDNCQHLSLSLPHKGKRQSCAWQRCVKKSQRMLSNNSRAGKTSSLKISHLHRVSTTFSVFVFLPTQFFSFPLSFCLWVLFSVLAWRKSVSVGGVWHFTELLRKKAAAPWVGLRWRGKGGGDGVR